MISYLKKQISRHSKAASCTIAFAILCIAVLVISLVVRSDTMVPNAFRGILIGLRNLWLLLLPQLSQTLSSWYTGSALARAIVNILCAVPFIGLLCCLGILLGITDLFSMPRPRAPRPAAAEDDLFEPFPEDIPESAPAQTFEAPPADAPALPDQWLRAQYEQADMRLQELQDACCVDYFASDYPLVRVQVFATGHQGQKDYILNWRADNTAIIPLAPPHEILFNLKDGVPCIAGLSGEEGAWEENAYPLSPEVPLNILRQDSAEPIRHYAITWIGG